MQRLLRRLGVFALFCCLALPAAALEADDIISGAAVLMDADTGQVLFAKEMDKTVYPASTTKIMTGILAVENAYPAEEMTASETAVKLPGSSTTMNLRAGEELTVGDALYALMLHSANDAANVLAEHVAGSQEAFAEMMTDKAEMIGAGNTRFANAHGLHDADHYTTAYDMALITRYAAGDSRFMTYFGGESYTMEATNLRDSRRQFTNYQYMLVETSRFYDEAVIAGKVGYTTPAGHTMSTVAARDGRTLIAVVMGSAASDSKYTDTRALLDYGFDEFVPISISRGEIPTASVPIREGGEEIGLATLQAGADPVFLVHRSVTPSPVHIELEHPEYFERNGRIAAEAVFYLETGMDTFPARLGTLPLAAKTETYNVITASVNLDGRDASGFRVRLPGGKTLLWAAFGVLYGAAVLYLIVWGYRAHKRRRARMRRLQRRREDRGGRQFPAAPAAQARRPARAAPPAQRQQRVAGRAR